MINDRIEERFWKKVNIPRGSFGCWEWNASKDKDGYGKFYMNGKHISAHRASYKIVHSEILNNLHVLHKCDNPGCVNPGHLFLGTTQDNTLDSKKKNRRNKPKGELHPVHKLSNNEILEIRKLYQAENYTQSQIGKKYKVGQSVISRIINKKAWSHIKEIK